MDANELRALADALDDCDPPYYESSPQINRSLDACIAKAADYLRAQADAQPVAEVQSAGAILFEPLPLGTKLYTRPAPTAPAGWKWVPVEPTPEMLSAVGMMDGYDWHAPGCSPDADHANWYSAMIAAAPAAPQAEPCIGNNPTCPCQDGDACHYRDAADGTKGWPVPQAEPIDPHMIAAEDRFPDVPVERWKPCPQCGEDVDRECPICDGLGRVLATDGERAEPKREDQPLRDLLAIIHCDGGHHTEAVGIEQSIKDAQDAVCALKVRLALAEPKREPLSDERIDTALQTDPVLITRLMIGSMTVGEFRAALRRLARIVERALEIGGGDAE